MELLQLRYFVELAQEESLKKVAENNFVSPSAVSNSIHRLENELGIPLFEKRGRNIQLNSYGEIFLKNIEKAINSIDQACMDVKYSYNTQSQKLTIVAINPYIFEKCLVQFQKLYPDIYINEYPFDTGVSKSLSIPKSTDFIIATKASYKNPDWEHEFLCTDILYLATPKNHKFSDRKEIDLIEAKDEYFINSLGNTNFRKSCDELCEEAGFHPKSRLECDYLLRPKMLKNEDMICITTGLAIESGLFNDAHIIKIKKPISQRHLCLFWRKGIFHSEAQIAFKNYVKDYFRNYVPFDPTAD